MQKVLVLGAGRSSTTLIDYLLNYAAQADKTVLVADSNLALAQSKVKDHSNGEAFHVDIRNIDDRRTMLNRADVVVSMLPPFLHEDVARDCVSLNKHLITASYVSPLMRTIATEGRKKGLIFMGELGLDPGIDHMSAMMQIDDLKRRGADIKSFRSYTGGLISPGSDDNPWHYKFTWNPRNVVLAGQGTAQYLKNGKLKYIPYNRLFEGYELVDIMGMGKFEMYANRDSRVYRKAYGLDEIPTLLRGTLRRVGFCAAWNAFIKIGLTDDSYPILDSHNLTYRELMEAYCTGDQRLTVEERTAAMLGVDVDSAIMYKLKWTGIFEDEPINLRNATPAKILEHRLTSKWQMAPEDRDMIIMQHEFDYTLDNKEYKLYSTLVMKGQNQIDTAMSRLVGLPLGVFVKLVLDGQIAQSSELHIPVTEDIYRPVLKELEQYGVKFEEEERVVRLGVN